MTATATAVTADPAAEKVPIAGQPRLRRARWPTWRSRVRRRGSKPRRGWVYLVLAATAPAMVGAALVGSPVRGGVALLAVLVVPGAALVSLLEVGSPLSEVLLASVSSASLFAVGGSIMLFAHFWHPWVLVAAADLPASSLLALQGCRILVASRRLTRKRRWSWHLDANARTFGALCLPAVGLWGVAVASIDPTHTSDAGLIGALPVTFFLAIGLVTVACAVALSRAEPSPAQLAIGLGLLVVMLYALTPAIAPEPRYTYTYKHLGVAAYLNLHGSVDRSLDIYQNWPGFFALVGVLERVSGISGLSLATWGQLVFAGADALAVRYVVRGLTADRRVVWLATWLYVLADWVGQNYLSPEAFGFVLYLAAIGVVLHHLAPVGTPLSRRHLWRWMAIRAATVTPQRPESPTVPRWAAVGLVLLLSASASVSHQLAPALLAGALCVLVIARRGSPWWLPVVVVAMTASQFALAWPYLVLHQPIFSHFGDILANASGTGGSLPVPPGHLFVEYAARVLSIGMWLLAMLALLVRRRQAGWETVAMGMVALPFLLVPVQPYGGEAIYRVYLFTVPWCTYLVARTVLAGRLAIPAIGSRLARPAGRVGLALSVLMVPLWLVAFFGLWRSDYVTPGEVAAWTWFSSHAKPGSVMDLVCPNYPINETGNYNWYESADGAWGTSIVGPHRFGGSKLGPGAIGPAIAYLQGHDPGRPIYLVVSPGQEPYCEAFGFTAPGAVARFESLVARSPSFRVVFHGGSTEVLRLLANPQGPL